jgi:endonuclease/exonuclease/phosphatase family metal-dependent hydrolase
VTHSIRMPVHRWSTVAALVLTLPLVPACADETTTTPVTPAQVEFAVMSRNVYLGADIFVLGQAQAPQQVPVVAGQLWSAVHATNFPERAGGLAAEVEATRPILIGLQEVITYRTQDPSDFPSFPLPNAQVVAYDFLRTLLDSLHARGLDYRIAARVRNTDAELPVIMDLTNPQHMIDVRLTMYDVILARADVQTTSVVELNYNAFSQLSSGGLPVPMVRGWTKVVATYQGHSFIFVNTHVEGLMPAHEQQMTELLQQLERYPDPVIVVGDLNTQADMSGNPGYRMAVAEGPFTDAYAAVGQLPGYTCCFPADVRSDTRQPDERIDFVLYRGARLTPLSAQVVGAGPADRTPSGLRHSDHAGVVATFRLSR